MAGAAGGVGEELDGRKRGGAFWARGMGRFGSGGRCRGAGEGFKRRATLEGIAGKVRKKRRRRWEGSMWGWVATDNASAECVLLDTFCAGDSDDAVGGDTGGGGVRSGGTNVGDGDMILEPVVVAVDMTVVAVPLLIAVIWMVAIVVARMTTTFFIPSDEIRTCFLSACKRQRRLKAACMQD